MGQAKQLCLFASILYMVKDYSYSVSSYRIMGLRELQSISTVTAEFYHSCNRIIAPTAPMLTSFFKSTLVSVCTKKLSANAERGKSFFLAITKEYLVSCKTGLNPSLNQTTCLNQLNSDYTKKSLITRIQANRAKLLLGIAP